MPLATSPTIWSTTPPCMHGPCPPVASTSALWTLTRRPRGFMDRPSRFPLKGERPPQSPLKGDDSPKSPFKGDLEGPGDLEGLSSKSPFKGDLEGPNYPKWQVADPLAYTILKENSKNNRRNLTTAETVFWKIAKSSGLGEKCRRQYIIGQYIVDFFFVT